MNRRHIDLPVSKSPHYTYSNYISQVDSLKSPNKSNAKSALAPIATNLAFKNIAPSPIVSKHTEKTASKPDSFFVEAEQEGNKYYFKLIINNINGNSNEVTLSPSNITTHKGSIEDISNESVKTIIASLSKISNDDLKNLRQINMPIFVINIQNVLSNGNDNKVEF